MAASLRLTAAGIDFVLLDIEGTTTPISFVHDVLFPYARVRVRAYLEETAESDAEIGQIVEDLRAELPASGFQLPAGNLKLGAGSGKLEADIVSYVYWLMDRDRKSGPLKALQGRIWEQGYATGALKGEVYPDVPEAFARWTAGRVRIGIYSSGSVLAQKLLFANSTAGDLVAVSQRLLRYRCWREEGVGQLPADCRGARHRAVTRAVSLGCRRRARRRPRGRSPDHALGAAALGISRIDCAPHLRILR